MQYIQKTEFKKSCGSISPIELQPTSKTGAAEDQYLYKS